MALFAFAPEVMRPTALVLNVFVALVAFMQYYRKGFFKWKLFWPFAITSVPFSFVGGLITLDADVYKKILGIFLLIAITRLIYTFNTNDKPLKHIQLPIALFTGAVIGLLSGMIGIGGGIILSPVILLLHWGNLKQTAAVSALFILVNSVSGLAGQFTSGIAFYTQMWWMVAIAFAGGMLGAWYGAHYAKSKVLNYLLAMVLLIASVKLIIGL